jgi:hypothetical protein
MKQIAICIHNGGYEDDLHIRTVYPVLTDESAAKSNYIRIIDESGEDYLYPARLFVLMDMPQEAREVFSLAAH